MGEVVITLLPLILGAVLAPLYPIAVLLLLQSPAGLRKAVAFVSGAIAVRLVQGAVFGLVFRSAADAYPDQGTEIIASTLYLIIGLLLLVTALRKWRKQTDPDDPPPQWMSALGGLSTVKAVGAGALLVTVAVKQWVFTLTAIDVIAGAELNGSAGIVLYLLFTVATQVFVLVPLLAFAIAPELSRRPIDAGYRWLQRNNRVLVIAVSLVFGVWFLYKGLSGLVA